MEDACQIFGNYMTEILIFLHLCQFQSAQIQVLLIVSFFLNHRLPDSFHGSVHVGDPHIRNTINIDFCIQHHALKILMADHFRKQPVIKIPGG